MVTNKYKRIPFSSSISLEMRAFLEDEARNKKCRVAVILNEILEQDFKNTEKSEFYHAYLKQLKDKYEQDKGADKK